MLDLVKLGMFSISHVTLSSVGKRLLLIAFLYIILYRCSPSGDFKNLNNVSLALHPAVKPSYCMETNEKIEDCRHHQNP